MIKVTLVFWHPSAIGEVRTQARQLHIPLTAHELGAAAHSRPLSTFPLQCNASNGRFGHAKRPISQLAIPRPGTPRSRPTHSRTHVVQATQPVSPRDGLR